MKQISLEESKNIQIEILNYFHRICKENNINYSLCNGTMLGAVRHGGYIPWDDDIDVWLLRKDYEKINDILYKDNNDRFDIITPKDKGYWYNYSKLVDNRTILVEKNWPTDERIGVNIDIFPLDEISDEAILKELLEYDTYLKFSLTDIAYANNNKLKRIIKKIVRYNIVSECRKKGESYWKSMINDKISKLSDSDYIVNVFDDSQSYGKNKCFFPKTVMDNFIEIKFENGQYLISKDYDEILHRLYGDYMVLPPKDKQVSNHDYIPYWK